MPYFGSAPPASALTAAHISDGAITTAKLASGAVDAAAIATDAVTAAEIAANAVDSSELVNGSVDLAHLSTTGTASSSTFLRGDNSWTAVSTPASPIYFHLTMDTTTASSQYAGGSGSIDIGSNWDSTNKKWVCDRAGEYRIGWMGHITAAGTYISGQAYGEIHKNGSYAGLRNGLSIASNIDGGNWTISGILSLAVDDEIQWYFSTNTSDNRLNNNYNHGTIEWVGDE
jgi:hypothetical protein